MKNKTKNPPKTTLDELFKCLSFYADKKYYVEYYDLRDSPLFDDGGSKARKILKKLVKEHLFQLNQDLTKGVGPGLDRVKREVKNSKKIYESF